MAVKNWSYDEHILAFNLYCKIPFTKINSSYQPVIELASILGRTNGSVAMKLANFARLDPALQARNISGLKQGAKGEEQVWNEFHGNWNDLALRSEEILASFKNQSIAESTGISLDDINVVGAERESILKTRVNQSFFRNAVLGSYNYKCCITGIANPELLVASHIIPWSVDEINRVNPRNGLCLNALHDKAFDRGFLTIQEDYRVKLSSKIDKTYFGSTEGIKIQLPQKFYPDTEFLKWHKNNIFME